MARFQLDNLIGLLDQVLLPAGNQHTRQLQLVERDPGLMAEQAAQVSDTRWRGAMRVTSMHGVCV